MTSGICTNSKVNYFLKLRGANLCYYQRIPVLMGPDTHFVQIPSPQRGSPLYNSTLKLSGKCEASTKKVFFRCTCSIAA